MKSADLLIHPAREEAAGNIIIEAIVSGLPSVVTESVGFSSEVLKHQSGEVLKGISTKTILIYWWLIPLLMKNYPLLKNLFVIYLIVIIFSLGLNT